MLNPNQLDFQEFLKFIFKNFCSSILFIWLRWVLVVECELLFAACGIKFLDQAWNPGTLHWELRVLATGSQVQVP